MTAEGEFTIYVRARDHHFVWRWTWKTRYAIRRSVIAEANRTKPLLELHEIDAILETMDSMDNDRSEAS